MRRTRFVPASGIRFLESLERVEPAKRSSRTATTRALLLLGPPKDLAPRSQPFGPRAWLGTRFRPDSMVTLLCVSWISHARRELTARRGTDSGGACMHM